MYRSHSLPVYVRLNPSASLAVQMLDVRHTRERGREREGDGVGGVGQSPSYFFFLVVFFLFCVSMLTQLELVVEATCTNAAYLQYPLKQES